MKLYVKFSNGGWNTLPCEDGNKPIEFIVSEIKTRLGLPIESTENIVCQIRLPTGELSKLHRRDKITDVLKDGDFVYIGEFNHLKFEIRTCLCHLKLFFSFHTTFTSTR